MNFFHVSCKRFLGAVVPLIVLSSVQAGALITLKHEVVIGDIVEKEAVLEVSMQYGMIQHPKETVVWFDTNKAITSAYHAAGAAYRKGEVEEAKFLLKHSVKTEPEFAARATKILDDLSPSLARTSTAIPSTITTHRDAVRTKQAEMETAITNAADTAALETLYTRNESGVRPLGDIPTL